SIFKHLYCIVRLARLPSNQNLQPTRTPCDSWGAECGLLSIEFEDDFDNEGNAKPVYLLKMTCPSTGFIHALRVPPDMRSAKEAIRWVNWDIDPEEFSVQT
ncbi:hypothetical protein NDI40_21875, partial [Microcoleus vaginatus ZQ-A3]|nr:hypothetical protein [Microcoleus sp. FACHB-45]